MDSIQDVKQKVYEAIKLLEEVCEVLLENNILSSKTNTLKSLVSEFDINPQYGQITVDSCFVIEEYYHVPDRIYTPIGYIKIPGRIYSGTRFDKDKMYETLESRIGLHMYKTAENTEYGLIGGWLKIGNGTPIFKDRKNYTDFLESYSIFERCLKPYILNMK